MSQPTQTKIEAIPTRRRASVRVAVPGATAAAGVALLRWYIAEIVTERHVRWHGAGRRRFLRAHRRGEGGGTPPRDPGRSDYWSAAKKSGMSVRYSKTAVTRRLT